MAVRRSCAVAVTSSSSLRISCRCPLLPHCAARALHRRAPGNEMKRQPGEGRTRRLLIEAFGAIAVLLVIGQVLGFLEWRDIEHEVGNIERNALTSIELIARMGSDVQRER